MQFWFRACFKQIKIGGGGVLMYPPPKKNKLQYFHGFIILVFNVYTCKELSLPNSEEVLRLMSSAVLFSSPPLPDPDLSRGTNLGIWEGQSGKGSISHIKRSITLRRVVICKKGWGRRFLPDFVIYVMRILRGFITHSR